MRIPSIFLILFFLLNLHAVAPPTATAEIDENRLRESIETLSSFGSRSTGSPGYEHSVTYLKNRLESIGLEPQSYFYDLPVRKFLGAQLKVNNTSYPLTPLVYNAITPEATDGTITAPVYYVGKGNLAGLDGKDLKNSIVLLDFDSGRNWQRLASLGVKSAIFLQGKTSHGNIFFTEKEELTPLQFPCFFMDFDKAEEIFGTLTLQSEPVADAVELTSECVWEKTLAENIYTIIEGSDPDLKQQLLIVESFFDNKEFVAGNSPGADAASSIATFLELANSFTKNPPQRSVLLLATSGHTQTLAGMRDAMWSLNARSKDLRNAKTTLRKELSKQTASLTLL